ncbi:CSC1-like protein HYP1 isoform X1 [Salvia splendens]|uniref:CSC1-like protein HYP1 isoform X1 n=2 Tax=Salvia splendens TaxID=180675 RepID=UPI001C267F93|nr:CSC1-like protein HYP1 isoform X1 [Salvia splendens]XP_042021344.1 CSC1-like protein HYP1 isoform X1 [Salvia splendens]
MILSALVTSVGINTALCFIFLILYTILRNRPSNAALYLPRLVAEGNLREGNVLGLRKCLSSFSWVKRAWEATEAELLENSGLDAVVFMRIFVFELRVFQFATIIGIFILLPFNYMGNQLDIDFTDLANKSLETFSISNVDDGSNRLWIHFTAVYIFTAVVCYLLYSEYDDIAALRISSFYSSKPQPKQFTVLVRSIPVTSEKTFSDSVGSFFSECYPSTYLSHSVIHRTDKLKGLINEADKVYKGLVHLKSEVSAQKIFNREGCFGIFGQKSEPVDQYDKDVEDVERNMSAEQFSLIGEAVPAAFVSFKSRFSAAIVSHLQQGVNPTDWQTEPAPDPQDVYWPFFSASFITRWMCSVIVIFACLIITILFLVPVFIAQGLTNLTQLETMLPFLSGILRMKIVTQVVTGYLPSLILEIFLVLVPPVMIVLSSMQGHVALSQIEKSACIKMLWFTIWNIFFANVLSGSALYRLGIILEPKKFTELLAVSVPGQASFFIAYVVTSGWTVIFCIELFRLKFLIFRILKGALCCCSNEDEFISNPYHKQIPRILFFSLLGIIYFFLSPLILPFVMIFYGLGYIIYRNQLLNVYIPKYETGGKFWPVVHDATIVFLILMHVIAIGVFAVKKVHFASTLTVPLPILTLLFNSYCQKRFLPSFKGYPAECLINKDRLDLNDPSISSFYERLATAYEDPAMEAGRDYLAGETSATTPLLRDVSEV